MKMPFVIFCEFLPQNINGNFVDGLFGGMLQKNATIITKRKQTNFINSHIS
jgi:hypothetical protein